MSDDAELLEVFKAEVAEQLDLLDEQLALPPASWDLGQLFHLAHNVKGGARMTGTPGILEAAHALEELFGALRAGRRIDRKAAGLVREGARLLHACYEAVDSGATPDVSDYERRVARFVERAERKSKDAAPPPQAGADAASPPEASPDAASPPRPPVEEQPGPVEDTDAGNGDTRAAAGAATVRIGVEKLQALMGLSSEFVAGAHRAHSHRNIAWSLLGQATELRRTKPGIAQDPVFRQLCATAKDLLRTLDEDGLRGKQLSEQLQDAVRMLRMVRVDSLRGILSRVVRASADVCGREAELRVEGGDTEIDRAVLDHLRDPLVHLVRNAVAHGIEDPSERLRAGKPRAGAVTLRARSAGSWVEIAVVDDGAGIDTRAVRERATERGMLQEAQGRSLSEEELLDLVFLPGLSTSSTVSEVAGRGFGMDIVRSNLAEVGGSVVLTTRRGVSTAATMRVPLTRLTTRALAVLAGGQALAIPMIGVERTISVDPHDVRVVDGGSAVQIEGALVPVDSLAEVLGVPTRAGQRRPAVVVAEGHRRRALLVDEVQGETELTMQPLPWNLRNLSPVSGLAVVEGGEVVLVLNPHELLALRGGKALSRAMQAASKATRTHRVLVVDDSVTSRTLERNILVSAGYEVLMAVNGAAALTTLAEHEVDLVITDVDMPKMNGIELTRRIRATAQTSRLPVILVTSLGDEADKRRGVEAGADAYIVKGDFDQDELLRAVARLL